MPRGYPRSRFEIVDQTQIQEITTEAVPDPKVVVMATYTSDKGSEDWEMMYGLTQFTDTKGGINFTKHGQAQLLVAEVLRNGGYVFGKRMVSSNATLANVTVRARIAKNKKTDAGDNNAYLYIYTTSAVNVSDFNSAAVAGYNDGCFDSTDTDRQSTNYDDFPLFTIAAVGRGASNLGFRIVPEYASSKTASNTKYSFEVWENSVLLESITFNMNPEVVLDDISQSIQSKINSVSGQVRCKLFEDGILNLVEALSKATAANNDPIATADLVTMDFINGKTRRGVSNITGIVTSGTVWSAVGSSTVDGAKPSDITPVNLSSYNLIPLTNGSYGTSGVSPVTNTAEYTKLLLGAWGKNDSATADANQFDPIIYDLDAFKPDAIIDCSFPVSVKNAIIDLCDYRGDVVFLADLGTNVTNVNEILTAAGNVNSSRYCAVYHNYFNIINPYTKKEITVTMPLLLAKRLIRHASNGIGRPFAGLANQLYFPEIIKGTVNFLPVTIPGNDQKQELADACVNYISYYDGTPVMETMYTNNDEYTQLSFLHNIMAIQEVIKVIRSNCPKTRYTFLDGNDLEEYLEDAKRIVKQYSTNFKSIDIQYMADEKYEANNIFYATIVVQFRNFIQEEYFKIIAIS